jgi:hypothetical protein
MMEPAPLLAIPKRQGKAHRGLIRASDLALASLMGSTLGTLSVLIWSVIASSAQPDGLQHSIDTAWWGLLVGIFSIPFVAVGLLLIGAPLAWALRRQVDKAWFGLAIIVSGAIAGKVTFGVLAAGLMNGLYDPSVILESPDTGLCYGVSAALALWWLLRRRWRRERAKGHRFNLADWTMDRDPAETDDEHDDRLSLFRNSQPTSTSTPSMKDARH